MGAQASCLPHLSQRTSLSETGTFELRIASRQGCLRSCLQQDYRIVMLTKSRRRHCARKRIGFVRGCIPGTRLTVKPEMLPSILTFIAVQ